MEKQLKGLLQTGAVAWMKLNLLLMLGSNKENKFKNGRLIKNTQQKIKVGPKQYWGEKEI